MADQSNEVSVQINLDMLEAEEKKAKTAESSGLIDLGMIDKIETDLRHEVSYAGFEAAAPVKARPPLWRTLLPVLGIGVLCCGAGVAGYVAWKASQDETPPATETPSTNTAVAQTQPGTMPVQPGMPNVAQPGMPGVMPGTMPGVQPGVQPGVMPGTMPGVQPGTMPGTQVAGTQTAPEAPKADTETSKSTHNDGKTKKTTTHTSKTTSTAAKNDAPAAPKTPKTTSTKSSTSDADALLGGLSNKGGTSKPASTAPVDPTLPAQLGRNDVLKVMKPFNSRVKGCNKNNETGKVTVTVLIQGSGDVSEASVAAPFAGTPLGNCVSDAAKKLKFPKFTGSPMRINMPYSL